MNPAEYAKTLVEKFRKINAETDVCFGDCEFSVCTGTGHGCGLWITHAKQCALICVEEIISILEGLSISESGTTTIDYGQLFYQQVKQDINNLPCMNNTKHTSLLSDQEIDSLIEDKLISMMNENSPKLLSYFLTVIGKTMADAGAENITLSQHLNIGNSRYKVECKSTIEKIGPAINKTTE